MQATEAKAVATTSGGRFHDTPEGVGEVLETKGHVKLLGVAHSGDGGEERNQGNGAHQMGSEQGVSMFDLVSAILRGELDGLSEGRAATALEWLGTAREEVFNEGPGNLLEDDGGSDGDVVNEEDLIDIGGIEETLDEGFDADGGGDVIDDTTGVDLEEDDGIGDERATMSLGSVEDGEGERRMDRRMRDAVGA